MDMRDDTIFSQPDNYKTYKCQNVLDRGMVESMNSRYLQISIEEMKMKIFRKMDEDGMFEVSSGESFFSNNIEISVRMDVKYPKGFGDPKWEK